MSPEEAVALIVRDKDKPSLGMGTLFDFVEGAFEKQDLETVDTLVDLIAKAGLGVRMSLSVLRATSRVKNRIKNWKPLRDSVYAELEGSPERNFVMRGLID